MKVASCWVDICHEVVPVQLYRLVNPGNERASSYDVQLFVSFLMLLFLIKRGEMNALTIRTAELSVVVLLLSIGYKETTCQ